HLPQRPDLNSRTLHVHQDVCKPLVLGGVGVRASEQGAPIRRPTIAGPNLLSIEDRKSTRLNSSHVSISYAVFCLKKKKNTTTITLRRKRHEYLTKWAPRSPDRRISTSHWKGLSLRPNYFP